MKTKIVKDLMVPLSEYATVSEDATLYDAIIALEEAQKNFDQTKYRHRAILIYDKNKHITGKISQLDILRALEPKYEEVEQEMRSGISRYGFSKNLLVMLREQFQLYDRPLEEVCRTAAQYKTKNVMYVPTEGEYVNEHDTLDIAIHRLVMGHHQSLLVTRDNDIKNIIGILRKTDVFMAICEAFKSCDL